MTLAVPPTSPEPKPFELERWVKPGIAIVLVVVAYRVSLLKLFEAMRLDTPLAHLALVPFIALGLAAVRRHSDAGPPIHDRQLDWIVGLFFAIVALATNVILPGQLSTKYWEYRIDLLTMPVFVASIITLLFGIRTLWKFRLAVAFLFLAWPYPYARALDRWLGEFTNGTIWAVTKTLQAIPLGTRVVNSDSLFEVVHDGKSVQMSIASACSGANGLVGFLLVAGAFMLIVGGSRIRKLSWLLSGALLVWLLNVVRIMTIFWAARRWGEDVAIDGFHPYMGLVVFNLGVLIMVLLMKPFGLRFAAQRAADVVGSGSPISMRAMAAPLLVVASLGGVLGVYNSNLEKYDRVANSFGEPRLSSFAESRETPDGWNLSKQTTYNWSKRFFGKSSEWTRYDYSMAPVSLADGEIVTGLSSSVPITLDVVETSDRAALEAYGVEQCYKFHNYAVRGKQSVDLGGGVVGGMLTWTNPDDNVTWTTLFWQWPIKSGEGVRYERVTMILQDNSTNKFSSPPLETDALRQLQLDINDVLRGASTPEERDRLLETRQFMIGFARELIVRRSTAPAN
jgi:exosortase/archaeosortase family protein